MAQKGRIGIAKAQLQHHTVSHKQDMDFVLLSILIKYFHVIQLIFPEISALEHIITEQQRWYKTIQVAYTKKKQQMKLTKDYVGHMVSLADSNDVLHHQIQTFSNSLNTLRYHTINHNASMRLNIGAGAQFWKLQRRSIELTEPLPCWKSPKSMYVTAAVGAGDACTICTREVVRVWF